MLFSRIWLSLLYKFEQFTMIKNEENDNHLLPKCIGFSVGLESETWTFVRGWLTVSSNAKWLSKLLLESMLDPKSIALFNIAFLLLLLSKYYFRYIIISVNSTSRKIYVDEIYLSSCHNFHKCLMHINKNKFFGHKIDHWCPE